MSNTNIIACSSWLRKWQAYVGQKKGMMTVPRPGPLPLAMQVCCVLCMCVLCVGVCVVCAKHVKGVQVLSLQLATLFAVLRVTFNALCVYT